MSAVRAVTDESFEAEVLRASRPVIVEYWAQWCRPIGPVLDAIAAERAGLLDVVKLNIDESPRIAQKYEILLVPTLNLFCGGEVVKQVIGARSKSVLMREFAEFLEPDRVPG